MTRAVLAVTAILATTIAVTGNLPSAARQGAPTVVVYKTSTCGCCAAWVDYMKAAGFKVDIHDVDDVDPVKTSNHVPTSLWSCHTALVGGYVIEGHVPSDLVRELLKSKPRIAGLAVPGMPAGAPGMEGDPQPYDVLSFDRNGKTAVYAKR